MLSLLTQPQYNYFDVTGSQQGSTTAYGQRHLPPWLLHGYGATGTGGGHGHWSSSGSGSDSQRARNWKKFKETTGKSASIDRGVLGRNDPESRYKYSVTSASAFDSAFSELSERVKRASRHVVHPSPVASAASGRQSVVSSPTVVASATPDGRLPRLSVGTNGAGPPSPEDDGIEADVHDCATAGCQRVIINVSGQRFETQLRTLARFPNTLLGDPVKRRRYWDSRRNEFFLDRHRPTFQAILYYYQSGGRLRRPLEVPEDVFLEEMEFYQLGDDTISNYRQKEGYAVEKEVLLPDADWQRSLWLFCEEPDSSIAARVFAIVSVICILVSVVNFCMETLPSFERPVCINVTNPAYVEAVAKFYDLSAVQSVNTTFLPGYDLGDNRKYTIDHNSSVPIDNDNISTSGNPTATSSQLPPSTSSPGDDVITGTHVSPPTTMPAGWGSAGLPPTHYLQPNYRDPFFIVESVCVAWFTIEFALRLVSCPSKRQFCQSVMNAFDVLAIVPYFVVLAVQQTDGNCETAKKSGSFVFVRVLRVFRIFKLSKHSQGLRILGLTIKTSMHELGMFFFFLVVAMVIFSSAAYYAEAGEPNSKLTSIPGAFWWAIVTMTTVGYGDVIPVGVWGKLVGTLCVIAGVLTIALPVPVVVANFNNFYRHEN